MKVKVVGIEDVKFKMQTGEDYIGQKLYYTYKLEKGEGFGCNTVFAKNGTYELNDLIDVYWSKTYKKPYIAKN